MALTYVSTRGNAPELEFGEVLLAGLARDGGLYVPAQWPALHPALTSASLGYVELAQQVMWPFVDGFIERRAFDEMVDATYATFRAPDVAPMVDLGDDLWLLELFHGPTLAFKDVALQLVGRLFDFELTRRDERVTIVGATSGDTGSAAIEACRDREALDIVILHPAGRVSEVQRRQMTTVDASNVHNVAIAGSFDDCQDLVKAMFNDEQFRDRQRLAAVNSINWARVMAQTVYYVWGSARLDGARVAFSVPTGNFGNVFAGEGARRMGLDVDQFVVGSNRNDILTRFFATGRLEASTVHPTLSPSMDIQISSNLERLLFEVTDRDGAAVAALMDEFRRTGAAELPAPALERLSGLWSGARFTDDETLEIIRAVYADTGLAVDPHTAVGLGAARAMRRHADVPMIALATAHPAKFPDAVEQAIGVRPALPDPLADLLDRPERYDELPNDLAAVEAYVADRCPM